MSLGRRQACDKVNGNMGPGVCRDQERLEEPGTGLIRDFISGTCGAGPHNLTGVRVHGGPPELSSQALQHAGRTRMAGET